MPSWRGVLLALSGRGERGRRERGHGTRPGGWVTLHGSKPDPAADRIAIVIEPASGTRAATLRLEAHGATPREREVATLLARGLTNPEIAEALCLSAHTVQDHTKSLFEKLGVGSRQEFVARVFLDEYLPEGHPANATHLIRALRGGIARLSRYGSWTRCRGINPLVSRFQRLLARFSRLLLCS